MTAPAQNQIVNPSVSRFKYAPEAPHFNRWQVRIAGVAQTVLATPSSRFVCATWRGAVEIEVECDVLITNCVVRPRSRDIQAQIERNVVRFALDFPQNISVEIDGEEPLFFFASEAENAVPPDANRHLCENVRTLSAGKIHHVGEMMLRENETLYIEGGAIVRGCVRAINAKNVRVCGQGVLDGRHFQNRGEDEGRRSLVFEKCENVRVENITMIEPSSWMLVLGNCDNVEVENLHQIGEVMSSDGIDVVGSRHVSIRNCFLRNNDDCIAVKAVDLRALLDDATLDWRGDVENVLVENCVLINDKGGNAIEIGYETRTAKIDDITFRNCDVLSVHGHGAVFAIHNGDRATVQNVLYENIRVEHHYDKLIDFRILDSTYRRDEIFGQIRNIALRDIRVRIEPYNVGYSISVIGGLNENHNVENVTIENLYFNDHKIVNADALDLYLKHAHNITFLP